MHGSQRVLDLNNSNGLDQLLRELAPQVLSALVRRYGNFDTCEDAVQEALLAAAVEWESKGVPDNPRGWLITVASRRQIELWRSDSARTRREETAATQTRPSSEPAPGVDDSLTLLMLCCHPSLTRYRRWPSHCGRWEV